MSDEVLRELREARELFRLPSVGLVEKDLDVVRAIAALAAIDAEPFDLVFGGGTALARAHRIIRRMSEDVDFKIAPRPAAPVSRSALRRQLERLRAHVPAAPKDAGFIFDPADRSLVWARDEGRYGVTQSRKLSMATRRHTSIARNDTTTIDYYRRDSIAFGTLLYPALRYGAPSHSHSVVLNYGNALIFQRKSFSRTLEHRAPDPSEIRALEFKGAIQPIRKFSLSTTIDIDWSIFPTYR